MTHPLPPGTCPVCSGKGYILHRRWDGREVQERCLRCEGAGWARERRAA